MARLEGFGFGHSEKNDRDYYFINVSFPSSNPNITGRSVKQEFVNENVFKMLDKSMLNKELKFDYEPGEYRPIITAVSAIVNK